MLERWVNKENADIIAKFFLSSLEVMFTDFRERGKEREEGRWGEREGEKNINRLPPVHIPNPTGDGTRNLGCALTGN